MIDKAICLFIDKRKRFCPFMIEQFQELGIPLQIFMAGDGKILPIEEYDHIDIEDIPNSWSYGSGNVRKNNYNIYLCHQKMLQIAKKEKLNNVLFLEDDAIILKRFSLIINDILNYLDTIYWESCYLGHHKQEMLEEEQQYQKDGIVRILPKTNNIGGFHGALLNHTSFDKLLEIPPIENMDIQCPKYTKLYYTIPRLIFYRNTHSIALEENIGTEYDKYEYFLLEGLSIDDIQ